MKEVKPIIKGAIFYANLDPCIGREEKGIRPVVILQNDVGNRNSTTTIIAPITTQKDLSLPTHVKIDKLEKIRPNSIAMLEQVRTIDISRLTGYVDIISKEEIKKLDKAILIAFGIKGDDNE